MSKRRILICTIKSWNMENARSFSEKYSDTLETEVISRKDDLTLDFLREFNPELIFFPHWSYHVPREIYEGYECIAFHTGDLPYGRGGSPLQNLIARGVKATKLCALRMEEEFDAGPVYVREEITLDGTCDEIFRRSSRLIFDRMIPAILEGVEPVPQEGEITVFPRRKPEDGRLLPDMPLEKLYDYIRMLDGEGYPPAFMDFGGSWTLEFKDARPDFDGGTLTATVTFRKNKLK